MISIKGPGLRIFAAIIAVIALGAGIYFTFFQSAGYVDGTATIVSIEEDPDYIPDPEKDNDVQYIVTGKYTVDGKEYTSQLNSYDPSYKVGGEVAIKYDPKDPTKLTSGFGFGIYIMIAGGVILLLVIFVTIKGKISVKKLKETNGEFTFAPSVKGEERALYFLTDLGTVKVGHRLEDKNRKVIYEAKMTKFSPLSAFDFDFIDHENNKTVHHLLGHAEETEWNSLLIDNNYSFTFDGKDVWKQLRSLGVKIDSRFGQAKGVMPSYTISRDGEELAYQVSYQQVYTWVKKFSELGETGLEDRRGQRTAQQEPRTEEEKLRVEIAQLKHELYMTRMERDLLKKLEEVERRDAYRK